MSFSLTKPGLFVTATDTDIGKTVVTCAIAANLRLRGRRVGVCKPYATGCRLDREGLVSPDAEALAHFADCRFPLATINPIRYHAPLAPAVAMERERGRGDASEVWRSLSELDAASDILLIEGVGGLLTPLDEQKTVLDLARELGYPVLVVTHARLGTLSHTAMTCRLIRDAGLRLAGLVINRYHADTPDFAEATNPRWLARQNDTTVLASVPEASGVAAGQGRIPSEVLDSVGVTDWVSICAPPRGS